jgi:hypothetical protein
VNVMADEAPKQQTILSSNPWQPPPASMMKINWNIVVGQNYGRIGFGVIVRDCCGRVVLARSVTKMMEVDSATTETLVARQGMLLGKEMGAKGIILEGDAKQIVQVVNSCKPCNSRYRHLVEDIQESIAGFCDL